MDTTQWPQEVGLVKPMEEMVSITCSRPLMEKRTKPPKQQALNCPRCNSTNTKFCYYNNYSLTQPRYFCKTCRRYWTEGGSLRNVPVGGGTRKNKRSSLSSSSSSSSSANSEKIPNLSTPPSSSLPSSQNPKTHQGQDLNLAFQTTNAFHNMSGLVQSPVSANPHNPSSTSSFSEILSGISSRGLATFTPMPVLDPNNAYPSGFGLHDLRSTLNFPVDGLVSGYGNIQGHNEGGGKLLFPLEDVKQVPSNDYEQHRGQGDTSGYWNGMLGGGSW